MAKKINPEELTVDETSLCSYIANQNSSRNSDAVMHLGRSISRLRKPLSHVMIKSTSDMIAALRIG